jgi:GxxExxY protein
MVTYDSRALYLSRVEEAYMFGKETYAIIGACMTVHKELGSGFLEKVYQEALEIELRERDIPFEKEKQLVINFKGVPLSKYYFADFVCFGGIILELKAVETLSNSHTAQILNYLKATKFKLGLLINFGSPSLQYKRIIL